MKKNSFERDTLLIFIFFQLGNVLNYCFQIIAGRLLSVETYGAVNTLQSWVNIFIVPGLVITMVTAKYVSQLIGEKRKELIYSLEKKQYIIIGFLIICYILIFIFSDMIYNFFHIEISSLLVIILIAIISLIISPSRGVMQGTQDFVGYGMQNLIFFILRFIICIFFAIIGLQYNAIMLGYGFAIFLTFIYCTIRIRKKNNYYDFHNAVDNNEINNRDLIRMFLYTIVIQLCISILMNGDMILVNALFSAKDRGYYSSTMVISKIPLYVSGAIVTTLFPKAATMKNENKSTNMIFIKAVGYGFGIVISCIIILLCLDKFIIGTLMGEKYLGALNLLPTACLLSIPVSLMNIIVNYALAVDNTSFCTITIIIGIIFSGIYAAIFHSSIVQVLFGMSTILLLVTIGNIIFIIIRGKR